MLTLSLKENLNYIDIGKSDYLGVRGAWHSVTKISFILEALFKKKKKKKGKLKNSPLAHSVSKCNIWGN